MERTHKGELCQTRPMKRLAVGLALTVVASACGGGSGTVAPETTTASATTVGSTSLTPPVAPSTTTAASATTTEASATTTPATTTSVAALTTPTLPTSTALPTSSTLAPLASDPGSGSGFDNPFTTSDLTLRDCLIGVFGQQLYEELGTRQPQPDEEAAMGQCMGPPSDGSTPSGTPPDQPTTPPADDPGGYTQSGGSSGGTPDVETARATYPPNVTMALLSGQSPAPTGFDQCMVNQIGGALLGAIRNGQPSGGAENDLAAQCLAYLQVPPDSLQVGGGSTGPEAVDGGQPEDPDQPGSDQYVPDESIMVTYPSTSYSTAPGGTSGFFTTAQNADITLSAFGFNDTGGPLKFNRPSGLTSDGTRLVMTDIFNNRVLIWNTPPTHSSQAPDLVLGQPNFTTNEPGTGRHQMNWPVSASTDGTRLAVTDTNNDRILIWTEFPTSNAEPADIILQGGSNAEPAKGNIQWPWGVWTDGNKLAVASTGSGSVLIWNTFPTGDGQPADLLLTGSGAIGTPRQITSDGNSLMVGDHNAATGGQSDPGTFFWTSFPTADNQPYDFFVVDPLGEKMSAPWLRGDFADDGRLIMMGDTLHIWNEMPQSASDRPVLSNNGQARAGGYDFRWGDFSTVVVVGGRVYITTNGSTLVVYDSMPTSATQKPDFVMGASDLYVDGNMENFVISNPVPASNGTSLFASSDFDHKLFVWKNLPGTSAAAPDVVYHFCSYHSEETGSRHECQGLFSPWDNTLHGDTFALAGRDRLMIWTELPLEGNLPEYDFEGGVGNVSFDELTGVAMDDTYFYVADKRANLVYVWAGIPDGTHEPVATLPASQPTRLSSDGTWLAANSTMGHGAQLYRVDQIATSGVPSTVGGSGTFNLPEGTTVDDGHLFVADTGNSQLLVWRDVADAIAGRSADAILGASGASDILPEISRNQMFWPAAASFDGDYLWVGERKFSGRLIRFSPGG